MISGVGIFYFTAKHDKHPGSQMPFDPEKKTLVVLGSGWGATSLLKTLDTTDYNVVRPYHQLFLHPNWRLSGCCQPKELLPLHSTPA